MLVVHPSAFFCHRRSLCISIPLPTGKRLSQLAALVALLPFAYDPKNPCPRATPGKILSNRRPSLRSGKSRLAGDQRGIGMRLLHLDRHHHRARSTCFPCFRTPISVSSTWPLYGYMRSSSNAGRRLWYPSRLRIESIFSARCNFELRNRWATR